MRPLQVGREGSSWTFALRLGLAVVGSLYAALLTAAMVRAAVLGGGVELAFSFFSTGVLVLILALVLPRTWRWALASRPRPFAPVLDPDEDPAPRRHLGLSGEIEPPTRW